ncbi:MAG: T9SS type A sorting domain-containing protein [Aureispira sp.]|nr:T9SS type A sorting domain-containing protein [Aureispira sp.]
MYKYIILLVFGMIGTTSYGQSKDLTININHHYDGNSFSYAQNYTDNQGRAIKFTHVAYYLSSINIMHDGGQSLVVSKEPYILGKGSQTSYNFGPTDFSTVTTIEGLDFDLGVDSLANHDDPNQYSAGHPLTLQMPSMHWGWTAGYFFIAIDGEVDTDSNGVPDKVFEFRGFGDHLLRPVSIATPGVITSTTVDINLEANVADWLVGLDLANIGIQHNSGPLVMQVINNTNLHTVFEANTTTGVETIKDSPHQLYVNTQTAYAPTIFYQFQTQKNVNLTITDMMGKVALQKENLNPEGSFFINKELPTGTYIATFRSKGMQESIQFMIQK